MKHLLSALAFVLFIALTSYGQYDEVVTGVGNSNKEYPEMSENLEFGTKDYFSVNFQCVGTGSGVIRKQGSYTNLCGGTDNLQGGYYATYNFIPNTGCSLSHIYVNDVDMINDLSYYESGSGTSYSWSVENIHQNHTVRAVFNQAQYYSVDFQCAGTGSGIVRKQGTYTNLCGEADNLQEGYYATYTFLPSSGSSLSHLYVNSIDMINELDHYETSSGMSYSWSVNNIRQNYTVSAIFNQSEYYSVDFQCVGTGSGVIRKLGSYTNLCGGTDNIQEGYYATYTFLPSSGSSLSHLYVNNVDIVDNSLGYYETGSGMSYSWSVSNVHQNYSIRAVFNQAQYYSIEFQCAGTGSGVVRKQESYTNLCGGVDNIQEGYYASYTFLPSSGSTLSHLYVNNVDMIDNLNYYDTGSGMSYSWSVENIRQNYTVRAVFNQIQYHSVDFYCAGTGSGTIRRQGSYTNLCGETDYVQEGYYATYSFLPNSVSILSHLYVNNVDMINDLSYYDTGSGMSYSWSVNNASQDYIVTATFERIYTINVYSSNSNYGTAYGGGFYPQGTQILIYAEPYTGYAFAGWNDGVFDNPRNITVMSDATYIAHFEELSQYTINVLSSNDEYGTVEGSGTFYEGTTITIEAFPQSGYVFTTWNDGNRENPRTITVTGNATYIASFADISSVPTHVIRVVSSNERYGTTTGEGVYAEGTIITIAAIPNPGYVFISWHDNNHENPRQVVVTSNETYVAIFNEENSGDMGIDVNELIEITLYPNPASDVLNITSSVDISFIEIVNVMGQVVARMDVDSDSAVCDVSGLANGVYVVRIYNKHSATQGLAIQRKFVKE